MPTTYRDDATDCSRRRGLTTKAQRAQRRQYKEKPPAAGDFSFLFYPAFGFLSSLCPLCLCGETSSYGTGTGRKIVAAPEGRSGMTACQTEAGDEKLAVRLAEVSVGPSP